MRLSANSDARSWKLRTARESESLKRSNRANGDGATGCGTGTGAAGTAAGGGAGGGDPAVVRRRGLAAGGGGGGGAGFRFVTRDTSCFARSSQPAHGGGTPGLRSAKYQYPPAPAPASNNRIASRLSHGPRRLRRRGLGAGAAFFSSSSSSNRNVGADVRRGAGGGIGARGGATSSGVTCHGRSRRRRLRHRGHRCRRPLLGARRRPRSGCWTRRKRKKRLLLPNRAAANGAGHGSGGSRFCCCSPGQGRADIGTSRSAIRGCHHRGPVCSIERSSSCHASRNGTRRHRQQRPPVGGRRRGAAVGG